MMNWSASLSILSFPGVLSYILRGVAFTLVLSVLSVVISIVCCVAGLFVSAVIDVPASAIIVLLMAGVFIVARVLRAVFRRRLPAKA